MQVTSAAPGCGAAVAVVAKPKPAARVAETTATSTLLMVSPHVGVADEWSQTRSASCHWAGTISSRGRPDNSAFLRWQGPGVGDAAAHPGTERLVVAQHVRVDAQ